MQKKRKYIAASLIIIFISSPIFLYTNSKVYGFLNELNDRFFDGNKYIINKLDSVIYEIDISRPLQKIISNNVNFIDIKLSRSDLNYIYNSKNTFIENQSIEDSYNQWKKADILLDGVLQPIKYKFHGTSITPLKKGGISFKIRHLGNGPYVNNTKEFNLISPFDDPTIATIAINDIAKKIGLLAQRRNLVFLRLNGTDMGLYQFEENSSKEWFEKDYQISNYTVIKSNDDWDNKEYDPHINDTDLWVQNKEFKTSSLNPDIALGALELLLDSIRNNDIEKIKELIDLKYAAKYISLLSIINNNHSISGDNLKYIYDHTNGKFIFLFRVEDGIYSLKNSYEDFSSSWFRTPEVYINADTHKLFKLLLKDSDFIEIKNTSLRDIINAKENIISHAEKIYKQNLKNLILNNKDIPRHKIKYDKSKFFEILQNNIDIADSYLKYEKVFISAIKKNNETHLKIINDSFSDLELQKIYVKNEENNTQEIFNFNKIIPKNLLDDNFQQIIKPHDYLLESTNDITKIEIFNKNLDGYVQKKNIYINYLSKRNITSFVELEKVLDANEFNFYVNKEKILIKNGNYNVNTDIIFPRKYDLIIEAGTSINIEGGKSILIKGNLEAIGEKNNPITIKAKNINNPFGTFAVIGSDNKVKVVIKHLEINGGSSSTIEGITFLGQLSIHNANIFASNLLIKNSFSDDGANIRNSNLELNQSIFIENKFDQLDLDFTNGSLSNSIFKKNIKNIKNDNGDGLDLSGSKIILINNTFNNFADKALSIGENSVVLINNNKFFNNNFAIAVKDGSHAYLEKNNLFEKNELDVQMFIKKGFYDKPWLYTDIQFSNLNLNNINGYVELLDSKKIEMIFKKNAK